MHHAGDERHQIVRDAASQECDTDIFAVCAPNSSGGIGRILIRQDIEERRAQRVDHPAGINLLATHLLGRRVAGSLRPGVALSANADRSKINKIRASCTRYADIIRLNITMIDLKIV